MYNVLEQLRRGEALTAREKVIHEQGLVSVLRQLHDELDTTVFDAYGWSDLAPRLVGKPGATTPWPDKPDDQAAAEEALLQRLVDLNSERAREEQRGLIRWLRPDYQNPAGQTATQTQADMDTPAAPESEKARAPWPQTLPDQVQALRHRLCQSGQPLTPDQLAREFQRAQTRRIAEILETLAAIGQLRATGDGRYQCAG